MAVFAYGLMSPLLGALLPTYSLAPAQQGTLGFAQAFGMVLASLTAGPLVDLRGSKPVLLFGLTLVAVALFAAPSAGGFVSLLAIYFALGIGGGVIVTGANSLVSSLSSQGSSQRGPTSRGPALNFVNLFFGLGGIITTALVSSVVLSAADRVCYAVAGVTVIALFTNFAVPMPAASGEVRFRWSKVPSLLANPVLVLLSLSLFLYVACEVSVWIWFKTYLISLRFDPQTAGGIISYGFALGMLAGRILASRLLAARLVRLSPWNLLFLSSVAIGAASYTVLILHSAAPLTLAVLLLGLSMAPVFPTTLAVVGDRFPHGTATAMGIAITSGWLGSAISSSIIGALASHSTLRQALLLLPCLAAAMVLVNLVLRSKLRDL